MTGRREAPVSMLISRCWALSLALLVTVAIALPAAAQDQKENYEALAVHMGTGPAGQAPMQIEISRWSTDEEAEALLNILKTEGAEKLGDALGKEKETGFVRFPTIRSQFPSTRLYYARQFEREGKRVVILATNRPIGFLEVMNQGRSMDYNLSLVELQLDANGNGEGVLAVGVEIGFDAEKNQLTTKNWSSSPVQLKDVKKR
jgi:hypothetical protein